MPEIETQPPAQVETLDVVSVDQPVKFDQTDQELLADIETALPLMRASLARTEEAAESALQYVAYMGFKFCEIKKRLQDRGIKRAFMRTMTDRFEMDISTIDRWMKVSKTYAEYLLIDYEGEKLILTWNDEIPENIRFLSIRQALKLEVNPGEPKPGGGARPKKNLLEQTMKFRGVVTKYLEEQPIENRDPAECFELVTSLDPLVDAYNRARQRCLEDDLYREALESL